MDNFNKENSDMYICVCCPKKERKIFNFLFEKSEKGSIKIQNNNYDAIVKNELNWKYIFFNEGLTDENTKIIYNFIDKSYYKNDKKLNTVIISLVNENDNRDLKFLDFFDDNVPPCLKPFIIFITKSEKLSLKKYKNYIKEKEIDFDERNIFLYNINILKNELPSRLWKICCYYNQISDEVIFPEIKNDEIKNEHIQKLKHCLNFFITGKPGLGKSTFINTLSKYKKVREGVGSCQTNKINRYLIENTNICIYDSPGFINLKDINVIKREIKNKVLDIIEDREQLVGIFYFFDSISNKRTLDQGELDFIRFLVGLKHVEIFFLLNFTKTKNISKKLPKERKTFLSTLKSELKSEFGDSLDINRIYEINLKNDDEGEIFGLDKLFHDLYNIYTPNKINIDSLKILNPNTENLENKIKNIVKNSIYFNYVTNKEGIFKSCRKTSKRIINGYSILGAMVSASPIPISDVIILSSLEISMAGSILGVYGIKTNKVEIKEILKSLGLTSTVGGVGWIIASSLKSIPVVGTTLGTAISVGTTLGSFQIIGKKIIDFCEQKFDKVNLLNYYINISKCFNKATDDLEYLSKVNYSKDDDEEM